MANPLGDLPQPSADELEEGPAALAEAAAVKVVGKIPTRDIPGHPIKYPLGDLDSKFRRQPLRQVNCNLRVNPSALHLWRSAANRLN